MKCHRCGLDAEKVTGKTLYPHRKELHHKRFFRCDPCGAHVGVHESGENKGKPFGKLANFQERKHRIMAHHYFDKVWRNGHMGRHAAYSWLASSLGIPKSRCHIGEFDVETCIKVIQICKGMFKEKV